MKNPDYDRIILKIDLSEPLFKDQLEGTIKGIYLLLIWE